MKCPKCNLELPDASTGVCPNCGHTLGGLQLGGVGILDVVGVEIGYGTHKSWLEQWGQVELSYKKLQDFYDTPVDNQEVLSTVKDFFIHCWHLGDWLAADPETSVQKSEVGQLLQTEHDLDICREFANTAKHHTLSGTDRLTARVRSVATQPKGSAVIEVSGPNGTEHRDALELATNCMSIWRDFLKQHGLPT